MNCLLHCWRWLGDVPAALSNVQTALFGLVWALQTGCPPPIRDVHPQNQGRTVCRCDCSYWHSSPATASLAEWAGWELPPPLRKPVCVLHDHVVLYNATADLLLLKSHRHIPQVPTQVSLSHALLLRPANHLTQHFTTSRRTVNQGQYISQCHPPPQQQCWVHSPSLSMPSAATLPATTQHQPSSVLPNTMLGTRLRRAQVHTAHIQSSEHYETGCALMASLQCKPTRPARHNT